MNAPIPLDPEASRSRIRAVDWSGTPLGPQPQWRPALRMAVEVLCNSSLPMLLIWGPQRTLLYNQEFAALAGGRDPQALGQPVDQAWPQLWPAEDRAVPAAPQSRHIAGG